MNYVGEVKEYGPIPASRYLPPPTPNRPMQIHHQLIPHSSLPHANPNPHSIVRAAGALILAHGGVVRGISNWGLFLLTKTVKKNQTRYDSGHHFILRFDASPAVQELVRKTVAIDPRMLRCGVVKMGKHGSLREVCDVRGKAEWQRRKAFGQGEEGVFAGFGALAGMR